MKRRWWKECVVYQIYPRSFLDTNGDGIGDLRGIIAKLDYLKTLGVDVVWLSPIYQSPGDDNGYDISDYRQIGAEFGTMEDFDELLAEMHRRGLRLLMDLVVNHTSDEHPWFVESRKSRDNPYRDYYIWRTGKQGREPNNWSSCFGGSAWEFDSATDEYYLHLFSRKQPDLNWENPRVRAEIHELMTWWLDKGIDGFRLDVINMISKVPGLPDAPVTGDGPYQWGGQYFLHGPRLTEFLREMKEKVLCKYDVFTVGETPGVTTEHAVAITDEEAGFLNMLFQFEHVDLAPREVIAQFGKWNVGRWELLELKRIMTRWHADLSGKGWNSFYLSNHDQPRSVSRFGDDGKYRVESAKMLATFLHLLHGTPYVYQGEEIGMTNVAFESIDDYRDIETHNFYREWVIERGEDSRTIMAAIHAKGRDNARTPMQWTAGPHAGFTTDTPWLKVNPNYRVINVKASLADPDSIFHYYRRLIELRRTNLIVTYGSYEPLMDAHEQVFAFLRKLNDERWLVILNFTGDAPVFALPSTVEYSAWQTIISNYPARADEDPRMLTLRPYEARVYRLE
ncbi:MAG TPA: alpha-glucosidase [Pirellulaceae bacterium]|nr:alpha-glucosidase [Pirellulaceae bacterium]